MYVENKPYIFISYAHLDSDIVLPLIEALSEKGFNIWYDSGIEAGSEWPEYIAEKLLGSEVVMVFLSENALNSPNCRQEIRYAISKNKNLLRIHLSHLQLSPGMEMQLAPLQALFRHSYSNDTDFLNALCNAKILKDCLTEKEAEKTEPQTEKTKSSVYDNIPAASHEISTADTPGNSAAIMTKNASPDVQEENNDETQEENVHKEIIQESLISDTKTDSSSDELLIVSAIKEYKARSNEASRLLRITPKDRIKEKILTNAVNVVAQNKITKDDVVAFLDTTIRGNGKEGIVFTKDTFIQYYFRELLIFDYCDILSVAPEDETESQNRVIIKFRDNSEINTLFAGNTKECIALLNIIAEFFADKAKQAAPENTSETCSAIEAVNYANITLNGKYEKYRFGRELTDTQKKNIEGRFSSELNAEDIIAFYDKTISNSGKNGIFITKDKYCYTSSKKLEVIELNKVVDVKKEDSLVLYIKTSDNEKFTKLYSSHRDLEFLFFKYIAECNNSK